VIGHPGVTPAPARRNMVLAAIDAVHRLPPTNPGPVFVARLLVGASLLALAVSVPSLGTEVAAGSVLDSLLLGVFALALVVQLAMIRAGAPLGVLAWSLFITVGGFLLASSLTSRELQPQQIYWLVLLPLVAHVIEAPAPDDSGAVRTPAPVAATILAIGLGILIVVAHQVGLTFGGPADLTPPWALVVDFVMFMTAASGLLAIHRMSVRETQAELRRLRGLLSVCAWCRKISDDGNWVSLERYIVTHERSDLTHGICPSCAATMMPDIYAGFPPLAAVRGRPVAPTERRRSGACATPRSCDSVPMVSS
jgi:hypothetical protein